MKKVKYHVGEDEAFGTVDPGAIVDAYKLCDDGALALLYHPRDKFGSGCVSLCVAVNDKRTAFKALGGGDSLNYVNLFGKEVRMFDRMIQSELRKQKRKGGK